MKHGAGRQDAETGFRAVFACLGEIVAYARRRGSHDPDAIAAEAMTIAWRKVADVPRDDPRPWLFAMARNLLLAERRHRLALTEASPGHRREDDTVAQPGEREHAGQGSERGMEAGTTARRRIGDALSRELGRTCPRRDEKAELGSCRLRFHPDLAFPGR